MQLTQKRRRTLRIVLIVLIASAIAGAIVGPIIGMVRHGAAQLTDVWNGTAHGLATSALISAFAIFLAESQTGRNLRLLPFVPYTAVKVTAYLACIYAGMLIARQTPGTSEIGLGADVSTVIVVAFGLTATFVTVTTVEINRLLGPGVFANFVTGRYHQPKIEERIFLLIDLRDSTHIAGEIGDLAFHRLLNRFYFDLTAPILEHGGDIHKYVGDELIATWLLHNGLHKIACVHAVFAALEQMNDRAPAYRAEFGVVPAFRAVLHAGPVVSGEMGDVKREIAFLGDTINTAARIETFAKSHGADAVISGTLLRRLELSDGFETKSLGGIELRGKPEPLELFALGRIT